MQYLILNWVKWFLERWIHIVPTMTCWDVARHGQQRTIEELSRLASLALPARFSSNIHFSLLRISFSLRFPPSQEQDGSVHRQSMGFREIHRCLGRWLSQTLGEKILDEVEGYFPDLEECTAHEHERGLSRSRCSVCSCMFKVGAGAGRSAGRVQCT